MLSRLAAAESAAAVKQQLPTRPGWLSRRGPLLAAAAVLVAIAVPLAIWYPSGSDSHSASNSARAGAGLAASSEQTEAAAPNFAPAAPSASASAASSAASGVTVQTTAVPQPGRPTPPEPSAGHDCQPSEVSGTLSWQVSGSGLAGTLTLVNKGSGCDLGQAKPSIDPLAVDGTLLQVANAESAEGRIGPVRLLAATSASSIVTWNSWCGAKAGTRAQVNWGTGELTVAVTGPMTPSCGSDPAFISSGFFNPLS